MCGWGKECEQENKNGEQDQKCKAERDDAILGQGVDVMENAM